MSDLIATLMVIVGLVVVGLVAYAALYASKTIFQLLGENRTLKQSITNLTQETQIGYAKVIEQTERDGKLYTRLLFIETDRNDETRRLIEKEYEIEGDIVHFDLLIVKFGSQLVMDGKERALCLWRRIYGERMAPADGFPIDEPGAEPVRYRDLCARLSVRDRRLFWSEIWTLADDQNRLREAGVRAIYGNVVYKRLKPGFIYSFKIDGQGAVFPEVVPAL